MPGAPGRLHCVRLANPQRKPGLYSMRAYTRVYARIRRLSAQLFILLSPVAPSAYARIRRLSPSKFKHVELSRPAQTSAGIPANHESAPRSPRADALFCIGTYADVYRRICSPVYTFIYTAQLALCSGDAQAAASVDICAGCRRMEYKPGLNDPRAYVAYLPHICYLFRTPC